MTNIYNDDVEGNLKREPLVEAIQGLLHKERELLELQLLEKDKTLEEWKKKFELLESAVLADGRDILDECSGDSSSTSDSEEVNYARGVLNIYDLIMLR
jgi:hypothetical protein